MLAEVRCYRLKASTILETLVAALVILLSFSAGMMLYHKTLHSGWSASQASAFIRQSHLADSLSRAPEKIDQEIREGGTRYAVSFAPSENFPGLLHLCIRAYDRAGQPLFDLNRMIDAP